MTGAVTIDTPSLGDWTCLATSGAGALVAGPQRETDRVLAEAAAWDCRTGRSATLGSLAGIPAEHANWRD